MDEDQEELSIRMALSHAVKKITSISESALLDVQLLLAHAMQITRTQLLALDYDAIIDPKILSQFYVYTNKRGMGYPVAYLVGYKEFYGRKFFVDERVLIPRPDTEILIESVLSYLDDHPYQVIREVGFGSGTISLTLACELKNKRIIANDISEDAYEVFRQNYQFLHPVILSEVEAFVGNLWDDARQADILVSNLPYLTRAETVERKDALWQEPALALDGEVVAGDEGLGLIYTLIKQAKNRVKAIFLEASSEQMSKITDALTAANFKDIKIEKDLAGQERLIWAVST